MPRWLALVCVFGCAKTDTVTCTDGRTCPAETVCDDAHAFCVAAEQMTACTGKADADECTAGAITGHCLDGVCLKTVCGDRVAEFGEMCDDGNTVDDETCSADCASDLTCGNG